MDTERTLRRYLPAACLVSLLPLLLLWDCVFAGHKYLPADLAEYPPLATMLDPATVERLRDGANYDAIEPQTWFMPELQLARAAVLDGRYPHWNELVRGGAPLAAHGLMGFLNVLHWPALCFADAADGLLYLTLMPLVLGGLLALGMLRQLGLAPAPAAFGAVAFALSGTMSANAHFFQRLETLAVFPGLVWAIVAIQQGRRPVLATLGLAGAMYLEWTAGFPPFCVPVTLAAGVLAAGLVLWTARRDRRAALSTARWLCIGFLGGLLLAMPQIAQQLAFFPVSNRPTDQDFTAIGRHAFDPMGLLGYLMPDPFGVPGDLDLWSSNSPLAWLLNTRVDWRDGRLQWQNYNYMEYALYPGVLTLWLAVLGFCAGPRWRWWVLAGIAAAFGIAIGAGPLRALYELPVIETVPPMRFQSPTCLLVALLAGCGVQTLLQRARPRLLAALAVVALFGGGLGVLAGSRTDAPPHAGPDPWAVQIAERYRHRAQERGLTPEALTPQLVQRALFTGSNGSDRLQLARAHWHANLRRGGIGMLIVGAMFAWLAWRARRGASLPRFTGPVLVLVAAAELWCHGHALNRGRTLHEPQDSDVHRFLREQRDLQADIGGFMVARALDLRALPGGSLTPDGIRDLNFYSFVDGASTEPFRRIYGAGTLNRDYMPSAFPDDARLELPIWDLMGIRYLLSPGPLRHGGTRVGPELRGPGGEFHVYERPRALPRARVLYRLHPCADRATMLDAIVAPELQPATSALVYAADTTGLPAELTAPALPRSVRVAPVHAERLTVEVGDGPPAYLIVADTWLPGWTCTVNGAETEVHCANLYQRLVALPAGACTVTFRYRTPGLGIGLLLGGAGVLLLAVTAWRATRRPRARAAESASL